MRFLIVSCQQGSLVRSWVLKLMNIKSIASIICDMSFFRVFCLQGFVSTKYELYPMKHIFLRLLQRASLLLGIRVSCFVSSW